MSFHDASHQREVVVRWMVDGKREMGNGTRLLGLRNTSLSFPPAQQGEMNATMGVSIPAGRSRRGKSRYAMLRCKIAGHEVWWSVCAAQSRAVAGICRFLAAVGVLRKTWEGLGRSCGPSIDA